MEIELIYSVNYCCTAKWLSIHMCMYTLFKNILFHYGLSQDIFLCYTVGPYTHSIYNSLHLLIPSSQSFPLPIPSPLATTVSSLRPLQFILTAWRKERQEKRWRGKERGRQGRRKKMWQIKEEWGPLLHQVQHTASFRSPSALGGSGLYLHRAGKRGCARSWGHLVCKGAAKPSI